jgi:protein TonB
VTFALKTLPTRATQSFVPTWSRAAMLVAVLAAHVYAFIHLSAEAPVTPLPAIAIEFAALPEPAAAPQAIDPQPEQPPQAQLEQPPEPDLPPPDETEPPPPEDVTPPPPESPPEPAQPPPPPVVDEVPPPVPPPTPPPKPAPKKPMAPVKQATPAPKKIAPRTAWRRVDAPPPAPAQTAAPTAPAMSVASYASLVAAELNRHKYYPESARVSGASGSVGVAFTIGPSGNATVISITSSSGNAALDSAARQAVASIRVPPPPGGIFKTATAIRFSLQ